MGFLYWVMYVFNINILWKYFKIFLFIVDNLFDFGFLLSFKNFISIIYVYVLVKVFFVYGFYVIWYVEVILFLLN